VVSTEIGRAPMLLFTAIRTPNEIRQISASQVVLGTFDPIILFVIFPRWRAAGLRDRISEVTHCQRGHLFCQNLMNSFH